MSTARQLAPTFTYEDYETWPDGQRWELLGGEPVAMSPSPGFRHQEIVGSLFAVLKRHFAGKSCRPLLSPFDLKLSATDIVQPDLMVVCDPRQIRERFVEGPPTLVVEVLSPSSLVHDRVRKLNLYARHAIPEYWLVTPFPSVVEIFTLADGKYVADRAFERDDTLTSPSFADLRLPLVDIFDFPLTAEEQSLFDFQLREPPAPYRPAATP